MGYRLAAVQWNSADGVATEYAISSLGFVPKAVIAHVVGHQLGSGNGGTQTAHWRVGAGFAISDTERRAVASLDEDAADPMSCAVMARNDCIVCTVDNAGALSGALDIEFDTDEIRLVVDDAAPVNLSVMLQIFGGDDMIAVVGDIAEPAATGNVDYTATGMVASAVDQMLFTAGVQSTAAVNSGQGADSGICFGMAHNASEQVVAVANNDDGSASSDTDNYGLSGECLAMIALAGGNPNARASFVQWNTDGFQLNWLARATTNRRSIFLAIKGGQWAVGDFTVDGDTVGNTTTVSGLAFQPIGISIVRATGAESSAGTSGTLGMLVFGGGTSTSDRMALGARSNNGSAAAEVFLGVAYDAISGGMNNSAAWRQLHDIDAILSDGFRLIVDVANAADTTPSWTGYAAFADADTSTNIDGGLEALTVTALAAVVASDRDITAALELIEVATLAATVSLNTAIDAALEQIAVSALAALVTSDRDISATLAAIGVTPQPSAAGLSTDISGTLAAIEVTPLAASLALDIAATLEQLEVAPLAATVSSDRDIAAAAAAIEVQAQPATAGLATDISAAAAAIEVAALAATVSSDRDIAAGLAAIEVTPLAAGVAADTDIAAGLAAIEVAAQVAGVQLVQGIAADVAVIHVAGQPAAVANNVDILATLAAIEVASLAGLVASDRDIIAGLAALEVAALPADSGLTVHILATVAALQIQTIEAAIEGGAAQIDMPAEAVVHVAHRRVDEIVQRRTNQIDVRPR